MSTTQNAMIQAAASIAALMPTRPAKTLMGNREQQLVFHVYEMAAIAAYRRAAQECFNAAYDAASGGVDFDATHDTINSEELSLSDVMAMCTAGYQWGGSVVTL